MLASCVAACFTSVFATALQGLWQHAWVLLPHGCCFIRRNIHSVKVTRWWQDLMTQPLDDSMKQDTTWLNHSRTQRRKTLRHSITRRLNEERHLSHSITRRLNKARHYATQWCKTLPYLSLSLSLSEERGERAVFWEKERESSVMLRWASEWKHRLERESSSLCRLLNATCSPQQRSPQQRMSSETVEATLNKIRRHVKASFLVFLCAWAAGKWDRRHAYGARLSVEHREHHHQRAFLRNNNLLCICIYTDV